MEGRVARQAVVYADENQIEVLKNAKKQGNKQFDEAVHGLDDGKYFVLYRFIDELIKFVLIELPKFDCSDVKPTIKGKTKYWVVDGRAKIVREGWREGLEIRLKWSDIVALKEKPELLKNITGFTYWKKSYLLEVLGDIEVDGNKDSNLFDKVLRLAKENIDITGGIQPSKIALELGISDEILSGILENLKGELDAHQKQHEESKYKPKLKGNTKPYGVDDDYGKIEGDI